MEIVKEEDHPVIYKSLLADAPLEPLLSSSALSDENGNPLLKRQEVAQEGEQDVNYQQSSFPQLSKCFI
jgi:hypothetical protein